MISTIDQFLLEAKNDAILCVPFFEDEATYKHTAGLLDWRLYGLFTQMRNEKTLTSKLDEYILIPYHFHHGLRNFLCVGLGKSSEVSANLNSFTKVFAKKIEKMKASSVYLLDAFFPNQSESDKNKLKDELVSSIQRHLNKDVVTTWIN